MTVDADQIKAENNELQQIKLSHLVVTQVSLSYDNGCALVVKLGRGYKQSELYGACQELVDSIDGVVYARPLDETKIGVSVRADADHGDVLKQLRYRTNALQRFCGLGYLCQHVVTDDSHDEGTTIFHGVITLDAMPDPEQLTQLKDRLNKGVTGVAGYDIGQSTVVLLFDEVYGSRRNWAVRALQSAAAALGIGLMDVPLINRIVQQPALTVDTLTAPDGARMVIVYGAALEEAQSKPPQPTEPTGPTTS